MEIWFKEYLNEKTYNNCVTIIKGILLETGQKAVDTLMDNYFYKYSHLWNKAFILSSDLDILVPVLNFSEKFVLKTITIYLIGPESNKLDK